MRAAGLSMLRAGLFLGALAALIRLSAVAHGSSRAGSPRRSCCWWRLTPGLSEQRYLATFDPRKDGLSPGAVEFLANRPEPFRFWRGGCFELPPCEGMTHRFACIEGVQPNAPARFRDVFWSLQGEEFYELGHGRELLTSYSIYSFQAAVADAQPALHRRVPFRPEAADRGPPHGLPGPADPD